MIELGTLCGHFERQSNSNNTVFFTNASVSMASFRMMNFINKVLQNLAGPIVDIIRSS